MNIKYWKQKKNTKKMIKLTVLRFFLAVSPSMSKRLIARIVPNAVISNTFKTGINATKKSFQNSIFVSFFLSSCLAIRNQVVVTLKCETSFK